MSAPPPTQTSDRIEIGLPNSSRPRSSALKGCIGVRSLTPGPNSVNPLMFTRQTSSTTQLKNTRSPTRCSSRSYKRMEVASIHITADQKFAERGGAPPAPLRELSRASEIDLGPVPVLQRTRDPSGHTAPPLKPFGFHCMLLITSPCLWCLSCGGADEVSV